MALQQTFCLEIFPEARECVAHRRLADVNALGRFRNATVRQQGVQNPSVMLDPALAV
jgi:hypothetical protein